MNSPEVQNVANAIMRDAGYVRFGDQWVLVQPLIPRCANTMTLGSPKRPFRNVTFRVEPDPYGRSICENRLATLLTQRR